MRTVVGVDPAVTYGPESDETGIVVAGIDAERNVYVLADYSGRYPPDRWAERVAAAYELHRAGRVVAEGNQGGDLVEGGAGAPRRVSTGARRSALLVGSWLKSLARSPRRDGLGGCVASQDER